MKYGFWRDWGGFPGFFACRLTAGRLGQYPFVMARVIATVFAAAIACSVFAQDSKSLTIGDAAPPLKVTGWSKGTPVKELKKGNVYVVEFWATWCGPCIQSMPHLSDMADKNKGKATFISVNTWDYRGSDGKQEAAAAHVERVNKFIKENDAKMRYNIALDDEKDTTSTTWMRAAGQNGIPCAFIINAEGVIAWIGHPMEMEEVLEKVNAKSWDLAAYKVEFEKRASKQREAMAARAKLAEIAKKGDMAAFDEAMKKSDPMDAISVAVSTDSNFGIQVLEKYAGKIEAVSHETWCSMAAYVASSKSASADVVGRATKIAETCAGLTPEKEAALSYAYLARCLSSGGKKPEALAALDKASELVAKYEPEQYREAIKNFIAMTKKEIESK